MFSGAFRERLGESWVELRLNPGRSFLQALGVMLGVASVLGGFSIADSQRKQTERIFARIGGIDKLNVLPTDTVDDGSTPSALQMANLGLRLDDATGGRALPSAKSVNATAIMKQARARAWRCMLVALSVLAEASSALSLASSSRSPRFAFCIALGVPLVARSVGMTLSLSMPPILAKMRSDCLRWLSEIENPPSTEATPSITPRAWRMERPGLSRISTQAS